MTYPPMHSRDFHELPYKAKRNAFFYWKGYNEGLLDCLLLQDFTTVEQRAKKSHASWGLKSHLKPFVAGYKQGAANQRRKAL